MNFSSSLARCPNLGLSPLELVQAALSGRKEVPNWLTLNGYETHLTYSCRTAIGLLTDILPLRPGDEVLIPAYNCGSEIDALLAIGLKIKAVDCDNMGFVSLAALKSAKSEKTRAVYIIHPFGWPHPLIEIDAWRRTNNLLLIEDCALALCSKFPNQKPIGTLGDASVFTFTKSLPVPDGGMVMWRGSAGPNLDLEPPSKNTIVRRSASLVKSWINRHRRMKSIAPVRPESICSNMDEIHNLPDIPDDYYFADSHNHRAISNLSQSILSRMKPEEIRTQRRANFLHLKDQLDAYGILPIYPDITDGVCPLSLPIICRNRNAIVEQLKVIGVATSPWWDGGHKYINWQNFPNARTLKSSILPLPVHQGLNENDMHNIAKIVGKFAQVLHRN